MLPRAIRGQTARVNGERPGLFERDTYPGFELWADVHKAPPTSLWDLFEAFDHTFIRRYGAKDLEDTLEEVICDTSRA